jgi:hypothetical protein
MKKGWDKKNNRGRGGVIKELLLEDIFGLLGLRKVFKKVKVIP